MNNNDNRSCKMVGLSADELKHVELGVLRYIDKVCSDNGIKYYLAYGTALGAVRHKGFIPWDDDIDIVMLRSEYERFEKAMSECKGHYKLLSLGTDDHYSIPYPKVIDSRTLLERTEYRKCPQLGAYVDIFIMDWYSKRDFVNAVDEYILKKLRQCWEISQLKNCVGKKALSRIIAHLIRLCPPRVYAKIMNDYSKRHNNAGHSNDVNVKHFVLNPVLKSDYSIYGNGTDEEFEGYLFPVPLDKETYLTKAYGNYMELPPLAERVPKHQNHVFMRCQQDTGQLSAW